MVKQKPKIKKIVVYLDLDNFNEIVSKFGLSEYKPNIITGQLTHLVYLLSQKYNGVILHGLDWDRGTEEALIEFIDTDQNSLLFDISQLKNEIENLGKKTKTGVTLSVGIATGFESSFVKPTAKNAFNTPLRKLAKKALRLAKKKKNDIVIL